MKSSATLFFSFSFSIPCFCWKKNHTLTFRFIHNNQHNYISLCEKTRVTKYRSQTNFFRICIFFLFLCSSNKNGESSLIHVEHEHILHLKNTLLAFATYNRIIGIGLLLKLFASFLVSLPLSFNSFCYISLFCYAVLLFWPSKFVNIDFCKRKIEKKRKVKTSMFKHNQWYKQKKTNFQKKTIAIFASSICLFLAPLLFYFICCLAEITEMCE